MKKYLFVALLFVSNWNNVIAQNLFNAPDTVCAKQLVTLTPKVLNASSYYWSFCSGSLRMVPKGEVMGSTFGLNLTTQIDIVRDVDLNYYGFAINAGKELIRLNFGTRLTDTPTVTNMGDLVALLPENPTTLCIVRDTNTQYWHVFVGGGTDATNSSMARLDFRERLSNTPNIANFGNPDGLLNSPRGLFIAQENGYWFGYALNSSNNALIRFDFHNNISLTPLLHAITIPGAPFASPTDMAALYAKDNNWYFFVTNAATDANSITRIDVGPSINTYNMTATVLPPAISGKLYTPTAITLTEDCGSYHAFVTNAVNNGITRVDFAQPTGPYVATDMGNIDNTLSAPASISRILRDGDDLYAFVANNNGNTLTRFVFEQCDNSSIQSSNDMNPPPYSYDSAGIYNIVLTINDGEPNMRTECKTIRVLPSPPIDISNDTFICQGDTIELHVESVTAISYTWSPNYNISDTTTTFVKVWPRHTQLYSIHLPYRNGCVIDTNILVQVSRVNADAGPNRTITDGGKTILGGPFTSMDTSYIYRWAPNQYINDISIANPVAAPPFDFTYYLEVTNDNDSLKCISRDTVIVRVVCNDINMPNAFVPGSPNANTSKFGLLNKEIITLNHFRIYDRWGVLVFETTDPTRKWDGNFNGTPAPFGVYVWTVDGFCLSGIHFVRSGNVTLIR